MKSRINHWVDWAAGAGSTCMRLSVTVLAGLFGSVAVAAAQKGGQSLASAASDQTAAIMSFQFQDFYTSPLHNSGGTANMLRIRTAIPFTLSRPTLNARLTLPYATDTASPQNELMPVRHL